MSKPSYKDWQGNNRFFLSGKLITGSSKDNYYMLLTYSIAVILFILYNCTLAQYLSSRELIWFSRLGYFLFFTTVFMMLKTTFTDPGVIPRGDLCPQKDFEADSPQYDEEDVPKNRSFLSSAETGISPSELIPRSGISQDLELSVDLYTSRYCNTCRIMRPPMSSHCSLCNNCVKGFDHHCFFLGNCIAIRNHKYFFLFLASGTLMTIHALLGVFMALSYGISHTPDFARKVFRMDSYVIAAILLAIMSKFEFRFLRMRGIYFYYRVSMLMCAILCLSLHISVTSAASELHFYEDPGVYLFYGVSVLLVGIWVTCFFVSHLNNVMKGVTLKEKNAIEKEVIDMSRLKRVFDLTYKQKLTNIVKFVLREQIESELE